MKTTYSLTDAQQNFLTLMQAANTGNPVKIESATGNQPEAVLLSAASWAAIQKQLGDQAETEQHHRATLYHAWGRL